MIKVRLIDSTCYNNWHFQFNSQLIRILSNVASIVEYRGVQNIGRDLPNVKRKKILVVKTNGRLSTMLRFLFTYINDVWQLIITPYDELLVYSFDPTISLRSINVINKVVQKRIIMFRHGSMEMLITDPLGKGFFYKLENKLTKNFYLNNNIKINKNIHFFVLGDVVLKKLSTILSDKKIKHFHSIDHPYGFDENIFVKTIEKSYKLHIGTVGIFNKYKGGKDILKLAQLLKSKGLNEITLSITGKIVYDIEKLQEAGIDLPSNKGENMVSIEEMKNRIDRLDFILFFYNSETYRLTASGAIFDAINRKRPIIAIKNDYFEYIFNKYGPIGYLVDNVEEMAILIHRIYTNQEIRKEYDFDKIQNLMSIENITLDFTNKLHEIGFKA